jgi:hypothetical protein
MARSIAILHLEENAPTDLRLWLEVALGAAVIRKHMPVQVTLSKSPRQRQRAIAAWTAEAPPTIIFLPIAKGQEDAAREALRDLEQVRKKRPDTLVVVGGVMGTLATADFSMNGAVDGIVLGDWIEPLAELVEAVSRSMSGEKIPGVWWRGPAGWVLPAQKRRQIPVGALPEPDLAVYRVRDLMKVTGLSLPLLASRGYPYRSLFSAAPLLRPIQEMEEYYETLAPEVVVARAAKLLDRYRPRRFDFVDELFPWRPQWIEEFATRWAERIMLPFSVTAAAEHVTRDSMKLLAGAGLKLVRLQLESGNDRLRARHSDLNVGNGVVREAIEVAHSARVRVEVDFLLGIPDESADTVAHTVAFAESLGADGYSAEIFQPWPKLSQWQDTKPSATIQTDYMCVRPADRPELKMPLAKGLDRIHELDALARAARHPRDQEAILDARADFQLGTVRSPHPRPLRVATFSTEEGTHDVLALRVPSEISWKVKLGQRPIIKFGMLMEPQLPGLRARHPIAFSVKIGQNREYYRIFQKVLVQALDPDSRRWHWFTLPIQPSQPGNAELILEAVVFGQPGDFVPSDTPPLWAGWAKCRVYDVTQNEPMESAGLLTTPEDDSE